MTDGRKRKRSDSQDGFEYDHNRSPWQSSLRTKIAETIKTHTIRNNSPDCSSEDLMHGFITHIWPEIREDYKQMTQYLEEELKRILDEQRINAEVSSRVKDDASIAKTLKRRQVGLHQGGGFGSYQDIFNEMHDLSGLRVVLMDRDDQARARKMIDEIFKEQKPLAHFDPDRKVGQFWRAPWFGAYETFNHRVQLGNDNRTALGDSHQYLGVMFEIQLTTFSDNLYNKLAHDLLYKADAGLITEQEEMVIDVSHGLARCFELCMRILRPKLHRSTDNTTLVAAGNVDKPTEEEARMAQKVVDDFEEDLHKQSESDPVAQLLRRLLSQRGDAEDQACLRDLVVSDPRDDKRRIEETKGGLLSRSYEWILQDSDFQQWRAKGQTQPFWITGGPGKGKTMMLCGIIDELSKESGTNISYFFCQATDDRINTGTAVLRGLLFLLCKKRQSLTSHIRERYDDTGKKLFEDKNAWSALSEIFKKVLGDPCLKNTFLVVDALDECLEGSRKLLVEFIVEVSSSCPTIKWILSSRNLTEFKRNLLKASHLSLESESKGKMVSAAVEEYIDCKVANLGEQDLTDSAVQEIKRELKRKSEGTFLWVAIVCQKLEGAQEHNLRRILQGMPQGLGELYDRMIADINALEYDDPECCKTILRTIAVALRPLALEELQKLADLPETVPSDTIVKMCRSFFSIRNDTVFFIHQSVKDHLLTEWTTIFQPSINETHRSIFSRSLKAMKLVLRQDMYDLGHPGISIDDVQRPDPDPLVSVRYSCVHWIAHFREAQLWSAENEAFGFLKVHFLHWFEALSLLKSASTCVYALRDLVTLFDKGSRNERFLSLAKDMYRFARSCREVIGKAPLQAYSSALIFSPTCCLTRKLFTSQEPDWIVHKPRVEKEWNTCLTKFPGRRPHEVSSIAFSADGSSIVSGYSDGIIKIWDVESGTERSQLQGHTDEVWFVAFDEKDKSITSKSDLTVKIWSVKTGACISTSEGSKRPIGGVTWSDQWHRAFDLCGEILIENIASGKIRKLEGHDITVNSVDFSRDGRLIVSGSGDTTVRIWDAVTCKAVSTHLGHSGGVLSVSFSPNARRVASGGEDGAIKIWDVAGSAGIATPPYFSRWHEVKSVALSLDGGRIASGSEDGTVKIWDSETGDTIRTIEYDIDPDDIWSVSFSPDGRHIASGYHSYCPHPMICTVVISDVKSGDTISTFDSTWDSPFALSLSGKYLSTSLESDIMVYDATNGQEEVRLSGHRHHITSFVFSAKYSHLVASASHDKTIKFWDISRGAEIITLDVSMDIQILRFDPSGAYLHIIGHPNHLQNSTDPPKSTPPPTELVLPQLRKAGYGINEDCSWITWHGQNVLWIPPDFRGTHNHLRTACDVLPHMVSIGCFSGRVWWLTFSSQDHPFELSRYYKR